MLTRDQDFVVETEHGIIRCQPKTPGARAAFKVLQAAIAKLLTQMPDPPPVDIDIDGTVGPSLVLAVQVVSQRLASGKHQGLAHLGGLQPEEAVPAVATHALEISGYIDDVLKSDPSALITPQSIPDPVDPLAGLKSIFTGKRVAAGLGALLGLGALIALGVVANQRGLGLVDRTSMMPPSDGSDQFDEDEEGEEEEVIETYSTSETSTDTSDIDTENAIDVESVEVIDRAA